MTMVPSLKQTPTTCHIFLNVVLFLEFLSCSFEVHIALGFAAACFTKRETIAKALFWSIPLCFVFAGAEVALAASDMVFLEDDWKDKCYSSSNIIRGAIESCCCVIAVALYCVSFLRMPHEPQKLRRRALARGFWYLMNFLVTFGPRTVMNLTAPNIQVGVPYVLTLCFLSLNGAVNALSYMYWIRHTYATDTLIAIGSVGTAFDEPRASIGALEQFITDNYFDLYCEGPPPAETRITRGFGNVCTTPDSNINSVRPYSNNIPQTSDLNCVQ